MTDQHGPLNNDENHPPDESGDDEDLAVGRESNEFGTEPDLRSILSGGTQRRVVSSEQPQEIDNSLPAESGTDQKVLPPVWPGDEDQPWFRKERGLPPLPEQADKAADFSDLPTPLADIATRGRAYGLGILLPRVILLLFPPLVSVIGLPLLIADLLLYRQGQDIGAAIFRLRVVRENGDVAGFYTMWVRSILSGISLLALGAGFWAAFSDPHFRTWHDRWLGTYVVKDAEEYKTSKRSSSGSARKWFWISLFLIIAASFLIGLPEVPPTETIPPTPADPTVPDGL